MSSNNVPSPTLPDEIADSGHPALTDDMKLYLQTLLASKEKQLQQAGALGQRVLAQQMELEERISKLQEIEADKLGDEAMNNETRQRFRELADTVSSWNSENAQLSSAFDDSKVCAISVGVHLRCTDRS